MTEIELPDGTILEAPDGLSPAQIKGIVQKHKGASAPQPSGGLMDTVTAPFRGFNDVLNVSTGVMGLRPAALGALGATVGMGEGNSWLERYSDLKTAQEDSIAGSGRRLAKAAETVLPEGWGSVLPGTAAVAGDMALLGGARALKALTPITNMAGPGALSIPARIGLGVADAATVSAGLGAVHGTGQGQGAAEEVTGALSGAVTGALSPWNLLGAAAPVASGLRKSAPHYAKVARERAAEMMRPGSKAAAAMQNRFGTGVATGVENAGEALLNIKNQAGGNILQKGQTVSAAADELLAEKNARGAAKGAFTKNSPAIVNGIEVNKEIGSVLSEFEADKTFMADPRRSRLVAEVRKWADGVMEEYGWGKFGNKPGYTTLHDVERFKSHLDDFVTQFKAKFPNPKDAVAKDAVIQALYKMRGKLSAQAEEAVRIQTPQELPLFQKLKRDYSEARVLSDAMTDSAEATAIEAANPTGHSTEAQLLEAAVRPHGYSTSPWKGMITTLSRPFARAATARTPSTSAIRNKEMAIRLTKPGALRDILLSPGVPNYLTQAIIAELRRQKKNEEDYAP